MSGFSIPVIEYFLISTGGLKQSGSAHDTSIHVFHDYTEQKTTWIWLI